MVSQRHVIIKQYSNQTLATQAQNFYLKVLLIFSPPLSDSTGRRQELQIHVFYGCFTQNFHFGKLHKPFFTQQKFRMETFRSSPQSKLLLKHYYSLHGLFSAPYLNHFWFQKLVLRWWDTSHFFKDVLFRIYTLYATIN